jgi:hypothetical protein
MISFTAVNKITSVLSYGYAVRNTGQLLGTLDRYKLLNIRRSEISVPSPANVKINVVTNRILSFGGLLYHRYFVPPLLLVWGIVTLKRWQREHADS